MIQLIQGDCLIESDKIESGTVDLILTDLPYGNMSMEGTNHGMTGKVSWDETINPSDLFIVADRILRKNGKMILFSQEPYTNELISKAIPNLPYNYKAFWEKDHFANALNAKKAMLNYAEEILIYSKNHDLERSHPLIDYFMVELQKSRMNQSDINSLLGNKMGGHYFTNGVQFCVPTLKNYEKLQTTGYFKKPYTELKEIDNQFKERFASTFNLWEGNKYKSNILKYKKDYNGFHPTQKPILLLEDLIKTFSNENDLVVDLTMGSGSTGVAAKNLNRSFIGIEQDPNYFKIAEERINKPDLFTVDTK
jgi:site-specific DNA-methyltransferase (adenine-specific)